MQKIGYLLLRWPRYSETFILNELLELAKHGQPTRVFCLQTGERPNIPEDFAEKIEWLSDSSGDVELSLNEIVNLLHRRGERLVSELRQAHARFESRKNLGEQERQEEPLFQLACALRLLAKCRNFGIKHLHCHYATLPASVGELVYKLGGPSYSFTGHAKDIFTMELPRLAKKVSNARFVTSCSQAGCATLLRAAPQSSANIHCVYHGIRSREWQVKRSSTKDAFHVISVGRLTPKKGFSTLVQALAQLRNRGVSATAEIIGEGREHEPLMANIRELNLTPYLKLRGKLSQADIREAFSRSSAFVMPSVVLESNNQDGIANAVLEAMAAAVPVVVSDLPALREVVTDGQTGLIFESGDAAALAEKLEQLSLNQELGRSLASAAQAKAAAMDCSTAAQQLITLFEQYATP